MNAARIAEVCWDAKLSLVGPRLLLRPLTIGDVGEHYTRWLADPRINAYLETRWQAQDQGRISEFVVAQNNDAAVLLMGIICIADNQHVGNIKLGPINPHHLCGDISYFIGETSAWGKGYAQEAIALMVDCAFVQMGLHRVQAGCYAANVASAKALARVGFQAEGAWRSHVLDATGTWQDHLWFGLLAEEWKGVSWAR